MSPARVVGVHGIAGAHEAVLKGRLVAFGGVVLREEYSLLVDDVQVINIQNHFFLDRRIPSVLQEKLLVCLVGPDLLGQVGRRCLIFSPANWAWVLLRIPIILHHQLVT